MRYFYTVHTYEEVSLFWSYYKLKESFLHEQEQENTHHAISMYVYLRNVTPDKEVDNATPKSRAVGSLWELIFSPAGFLEEKIYSCDSQYPLDYTGLLWRAVKQD